MSHLTSSITQQALRLFVVLILVFISNAIFSQENSLQKTPKQLPVLDLPLSLEKIQNFIEKFNQDSPYPGRIETADDLFSHLPFEVSRRQIFMRKSGSPQSASDKYPRLILRSPDASFVFSISTDPKSDNYGAIEVLEYDPQKRSLRAAEIIFSKATIWDEKNKKLIKIELPHDKKLTGSKSFKILNFPDKDSSLPIGESGHGNRLDCRQCHGKDIRFLWDPYDAWQGMVPFFSDNLIKDQKESKVFENIFKDKQHRPYIRHLPTPPILSRQDPYAPEHSRYEAGKDIYPAESKEAMELDRPLNRNSFRVDPTIPEGGNGAEFYEMAFRISAHRVWRLLEEFSEIERVKYALLGAYSRCENFEDFFPEQVRKNHEAYFSGKSLKQLQEDTKERQQNYIYQQINIHKRLIHENHLPFEEDYKSKENSHMTVAKYRFLLGPEGMDVSSWSLSLDPKSYTFGDRLYNLERDFKAGLQKLIPEALDPLDQKRKDVYKTDAEYAEFKKTIFFDSEFERISEVNAKSLDKNYYDDNLVNYQKYKLCMELARKSRAALMLPRISKTASTDIEAPYGQRQAAEENCPDTSATNMDSTVKESSASAEEILSFQFPHSCLQCHSQSTGPQDGPTLPLLSQERATLMNDSKLIDELWDRINRTDELRMPPPPGAALTKKEVEEVKKFLKKIRPNKKF